MASSSRFVSSHQQMQQLSPLMKVVLFLPLTILLVEKIMNTMEIMSYTDQLHVYLEAAATDLTQPHHFHGVPPLSKVPMSLTNDVLQQQEGNPLTDKQQQQQQQQRKDGEGRDPSRNIRIPLSEIIGDEPVCPDNLQPVPCNMAGPEQESNFYKTTEGNGDRKIPKIIHQTSKSRCMTKKMNEVVANWRNLGDGYHYYFHSDEAIHRLLRERNWPEFPHLPQVLNCIPKSLGTVLADLWRYIVLWEYGGIYADIDTKPNKFNASTISDTDEAFFVVEQYHLLSQYFFAAAPRHPILFYSIHSTLLNLLSLSDIGSMQAPRVSGPHALHAGFQQFMLDYNVTLPNVVPGAKPAKAGIWVGTEGHTLTVAGIGENENEYVEREYLRRFKKVKEYEQMGMKHFTSYTTSMGQTCRQTLWKARDYYQEQDDRRRRR